MRDVIDASAEGAIPKELNDQEQAYLDGFARALQETSVDEGGPQAELANWLMGKGQYHCEGVDFKEKKSGKPFYSSLIAQILRAFLVDAQNKTTYRLIIRNCMTPTSITYNIEHQKISGINTTPYGKALTGFG
ncbi:hypothetical protein BDP27DRAFT_1371726 [Rhodocollybia butyracea]|uniref:Uncharacterized protein n=1 Tax=Rhodocollybia butyracea TaxID=206335 RepID=A0A9P5PBI1_9AGAR|nr:hypothetical protein BDP27DRAFT_1371726 [Rhodocollybia butyracea]